MPLKGWKPDDVSCVAKTRSMTISRPRPHTKRNSPKILLSFREYLMGLSTLKTSWPSKAEAAAIVISLRRMSWKIKIHHLEILFSGDGKIANGFFATRQSQWGKKMEPSTFTIFISLPPERKPALDLTVLRFLSGARQQQGNYF